MAAIRGKLKILKDYLVTVALKRRGRIWSFSKYKICLMRIGLLSSQR